MTVRAIFFDVANTLLYKPALLPTLHGVLRRHGFAVAPLKLREYHRVLSEVIVFPDRTSSAFYQEFNAHLLRTLGIVPNEYLLDELYASCRGLPWAPFADTDGLQRLDVPLGVLSNWDASLVDKLAALIEAPFRWTLGSAERGLRKPDPAFYQCLLDCVGVPAAEVVYVGDSLRLDLEPALRLGLRAVLIDRDRHYADASVPRIESLHELEAWL